MSSSLNSSMETTASAHVARPSMPKIGWVRDMAESTICTSIPSNYNHSSGIDARSKDDSSELVVEAEIPTIDFSLLTSSSPDQRSKTVQELGKACQDWGFFMVINHGVPQSLTEKMLKACQDFFNQPEEEKLRDAGKNVLDPIRCGTSFNASVEKVLFWRDFLKVLVHPEFHSPATPVNFREISFEYCQRTRQVARQLLKGISESLGLDENYIDKAMELDSCFQILIGNLYPPCPQPDLAMGLPPHSDHGLLTLLVANQVRGLQLKHNGQWVNVKALPNSFLVNTGDHIEILSNGRYKSVIHRAVVNNKATRISLAMAHGPRLGKVVTPAPELANNVNNPAAYLGITYREYITSQQSNPLDRKSCLDRVRV